MKSTQSDYDAIVERANRLARGADIFLWGDAYFAASRLLREPEANPGLFFSDCDDDVGARLVALAFALAVLADDCGNAQVNQS